jgi:hypothetical protein
MTRSAVRVWRRVGESTSEGERSTTRTLLAAASAALVLVTVARTADAQTTPYSAASGTRAVPTNTIEQFMETVQLGRAHRPPG